MNYASAVLFGYTELVESKEEKVDALTRITNEPFKNLSVAGKGGEFARGDRWADGMIPSDADVQVSVQTCFIAIQYSTIYL